MHCILQEKLRMIQRSSELLLYHSPREQGWFLLNFKGWGLPFWFGWVKMPLPRTLGWCCLHRELQGWFQEARASAQSCSDDVATPADLEGRTLSQRGLFWSIKVHGICLAGFWLLWDPSPLPSFQFRLSGMGMSLLCLIHHEILETHNLCGFTVHSWGGILPQVPSISD